jgi:hypothetical protein
MERNRLHLGYSKVLQRFLGETEQNELWLFSI